MIDISKDDYKIAGEDLSRQAQGASGHAQISAADRRGKQKREGPESFPFRYF
jgi:hypothetical protein